MPGWLAAGAVTVGMGVAMVGGVAVANADTDSPSSSPSSSSSSSSESSASESSSSTGTETSSTSETSSSGGKVVDKDAASETASEAQADTRSRNSGTPTTQGAVSDRDDTAAKRFGKRLDKDKAAAEEAASESQTVSHDSVSVTSAGTDETSAAQSITPSSATNAAVTDDVEIESSRGPPQPTVDAAPVAEPAAATPASPLHTLWQDIVRHLQYTFANVAPTMAPTNGSQASNGSVTGALNGKSNNGFGLTYTVTRGPEHGTVVIDQESGQYTYTPKVSDPRFTDSFEITADNGTAARLPGLAGAVQGALHGFAQNLGFAKADTVSAVVSVTAVWPGTIGDPTNAQYWAEQNYQDCVLMSVAMITGQLRGVRPTDQTEQDIIAEASRTRSVVDPSRMMWYSSTQLGVYYRDGEQLLKNHGFDTEYRTYGPERGSTSDAGIQALTDLSRDLAAGHGVLVATNPRSLWHAEQTSVEGGNIFVQNHAIVVLAYDVSRGIVYINDSGYKTDKVGQGAAVTIGAFMWAWQTSGYITVVAKKPEQESLALAA